EHRPTLDPERSLMGKEIQSRIARAMERLSPRERVVFEMKHYQGLKLRAIGDALGTTEETVKNSLFRATRKLRSELEGLRSATLPNLCAAQTLHRFLCSIPATKLLPKSARRLTRTSRLALSVVLNLQRKTRFRLRSIECPRPPTSSNPQESSSRSAAVN